MLDHVDLYEVLAGNRSLVDLPELHFSSLEDTLSFLRAYGFDWSREEDQKKILYYYRRTLVYLQEKLLMNEDQLPQWLTGLSLPEEWLQRILWEPFRSFPEGASSPERVWACVILRVMHAFVHAENDLFHLFSQEIQSQVLTPFLAFIFTEGAKAQSFLKGRLFGKEFSLPLAHFEVKPHKTSVSSVTKLLAKAETHMIDIHDKIGVRLVTEYLWDVFLVLEFLLQNHVVSPAHVMAGQTTNSIYPTEVFQRFINEYRSEVEKLGWLHIRQDPHLRESWERQLVDFSQRQDNVELVKKNNPYSAGDYQFIKFVERKLIRLPEPLGGGRFFYPFEVQILTAQAYQSSLQGEGDHENYKKRQLEAARRRVLRSLYSASPAAEDRTS
jgi:uncharacterized protein (TIGR04562 family)